jgi:hypothetical protein
MLYLDAPTGTWYDWTESAGTTLDEKTQKRYRQMLGEPTDDPGQSRYGPHLPAYRAGTDAYGTLAGLPALPPDERAEAEHVFVWHHMDNASYTQPSPGPGGGHGSRWPYLIRFLYRLHDPRGRLESRPGGNRRVEGMLFEHVLSVPRPLN